MRLEWVRVRDPLFLDRLTHGDDIRGELGYYSAKGIKHNSLQSFVWPFSVLACPSSRPFGFSLTSSSFKVCLKINDTDYSFSRCFYASVSKVTIFAMVTETKFLHPIRNKKFKKIQFQQSEIGYQSF